MNTIGAAIDRGEIEVNAISWEAFNDIYVPVCADCELVSADASGMVCTLFDSPHNSVEPEPTNPTSSAPLMSAIYRCSLKRRKA